MELNFNAFHTSLKLDKLARPCRMLAEDLHQLLGAAQGQHLRNQDKTCSG